MTNLRQAELTKQLIKILDKYGIGPFGWAKITLFDIIVCILPKLYAKCKYRAGGLDSYYRRLIACDIGMSTQEPNFFIAHAKTLFLASALYPLQYLTRGEETPKRLTSREPKASIEYAKKNLQITLDKALLDSNEAYAVLGNSYGVGYKHSENPEMVAPYKVLGNFVYDTNLSAVTDTENGPYDWYMDYLIDYGDKIPNEDTGLYMSWKKAFALYGPNGVHREFRSEPFLKSIYLMDRLSYTHAILKNYSLYKDAIKRAKDRVETVDVVKL